MFKVITYKGNVEMTGKTTKLGYLFQVISILTISLYAAIFSISPLNGEDYALTRIFENESFLYKLTWIAERSHDQMSRWNARLGEQLAIFWLSMPEIYFLIASTLIFVTFNFLVSSIYSGTKEAIEKTTISICLIFLLWPGMEVFFWKTANAGYLQPIVLTLICIYFYSREETITKLLENKVNLTLVSIAAFLSGLSFENTPIAVSFYMLVSFTLLKKKKEQLLALLPMGAMIFGWLILISAASTTKRRDYYNNHFGVTGYSVDYIADRVLDVSRIFFLTSNFLFFASIIALVYIFIYSKNRKRVLLNTIPAILVVGSVAAAPYTEPRSFILAWALMLSAVVEAIHMAFKNIRFSRVLALIIFSLSLFYQIKTYQIYTDFAKLLNDRDDFIRSKIGTAECSNGIEVTQIQTNYSYRYLNNRDEWYHGNPRQISKYYNCNILMK